MPRNLSPLALQSALARQTGEAWLFLLEIEHPDEPQPIRWVNDTAEIIHLGETYEPYPFELQLTLDDEERIPEVGMRLDNVERALMALVRQSDVAPTFAIKIVLASQPDVIEVEMVGLSLLEITYDAYSVEGTLYPDDLLDTRYPRDVVSIAGGFQGLFRQ